MKIEKTSGEDYERMFDEIAKEQPQAETVEQAAQALFDRGSYKNDSQLQLCYLAGARFGSSYERQKTEAIIKKVLERAHKNAIDDWHNSGGKGFSRPSILSTKYDDLIYKP